MRVNDRLSPKAQKVRQRQPRQPRKPRLQKPPPRPDSDQIGCRWLQQGAAVMNVAVDTAVIKIMPDASLIKIMADTALIKIMPAGLG